VHLFCYWNWMTHHIILNVKFCTCTHQQSNAKIKRPFSTFCPTFDHKCKWCFCFPPSKIQIAWFWNQVHAQPTKIEIENLNNILYNIRKIKIKS
jgi:hypothetical protein